MVTGDLIIKLNSLLSLRGLDLSGNGDLLPLIEGADENTLRLLKEELESFSPSTLSRMTTNGDAVNLRGVRLRAPLLRPPAVFCLGFNYRSHAPELGEAIPGEELLDLFHDLGMRVHLETTITYVKNGKRVSLREKFKQK